MIELQLRLLEEEKRRARAEEERANYEKVRKRRKGGREGWRDGGREGGREGQRKGGREGGGRALLQCHMISISFNYLIRAHLMSVFNH